MRDFVRTLGDRLVAGDTADTVYLRGIAIHRSERPEPSPEDYTELARLGANTIRLAFSYRDFYDPARPDRYKEDAWL